jgi:hypothetical protein
MAFKSKAAAKAAARKGGLARQAKRRAKGEAPEPYSGPFSTFLPAVGLDGPTWAPWAAFYAAKDGVPLSDDVLAIYRACTGRQDAPAQPARESFAVVGRRGGKSRAAAAYAMWTGIRTDWTRRTAPGEAAWCLLIGADKQQAALLLSYCKAISRTPLVAPFVRRTLKDRIELLTGAHVAVATASHKTTRGYSLALAVLDELAFWNADELGASPDVAIREALVPGLVTLHGSLIGLSSPYAKKGLLWDAYRRGFGVDVPGLLVWQSPSLTMNATLDADVIADAIARDPAAGASEWLGQFRSDLQAFVDLDTVMSCTVPGVRERPPVPGLAYTSFVDVAGGSGTDSYAVAIGHMEEETAVVDALRCIAPPFSPQSVTAEVCALMATYGIGSIEGDKFGGSWPSEAFGAHHVEYVPAVLTRSQLYRELLPALNSRRCSLLDHRPLQAQLTGLERRVGRGADAIDHAQGQHDDAANAVAGLVVGLLARGAGAVALDAGAVAGFVAGNDALTRRNDLLGADSRWAGPSESFGEDGDGSINCAYDWPSP